MAEELPTYGNMWIEDFNGEVRRGGDIPSLRFALNKRLLIKAFSYDQFSAAAKKLIKMAEAERGEVTKEVLGFRIQEDYDKVRGIQRGDLVNPGLVAKILAGNTEQAMRVLNSARQEADISSGGRTRLRWEKFGEGAYEEMIDCHLWLKDKKTQNLFALALGVDCNKRRMTFYGQGISVDLYRTIAREFHKPSLVHYVSEGMPV